jgi:hypothetical protein
VPAGVAADIEAGRAIASTAEADGERDLRAPALALAATLGALVAGVATIGRRRRR